MTNTSTGATQVAKAEFRIGDILDRSIGLVSRNFAAYVGLMAVIVPGYVFLNLQIVGVPPKELVANWPSLVVPFLLIIILSIVGQTFVIDAAFQDLSGQPVKIGESVQRAFARLPAIFVMSICLVIATLIGYLLFIVPGIIVQTILFVALPVCLVEKLGPIASLGRSRALTKGYRWKVFATAFLVALGGGIAMAVIGTVIGFIGALVGIGGLLQITVGVAMRTVFAAFFAVVVAVIYHDLRVAKEGPGLV